VRKKKDCIKLLKNCSIPYQGSLEELRNKCILYKMLEKVKMQCLIKEALEKLRRECKELECSIKSEEDYL